MASRVFIVRGQGGLYSSVFRKNGYIGIGFFKNDTFKEKWDLSSKEFLVKEYRKLHIDLDDRRIGIYTGQAHRFVNSITIGDIVICPYSDNSLLIGQVEGGLYFSDDKSSPLTWRKRVNWLKDKVDRKIFSKPLWFALRSSQTVFEIKQTEEVISLISQV